MDASKFAAQRLGLLNSRSKLAILILALPDATYYYLRDDTRAQPHGICRVRGRNRTDKRAASAGAPAHGTTSQPSMIICRLAA
jgi:hypothetical protein